jgi:uncharacterized protein YqjF (DUF2071 family)
MQIMDGQNAPPVANPLMLQNRENVTFLHWRYPAEIIQPFLPKGLQLDLFDNSAWVGFIPFQVTGLRSHYVPAMPWISQFPAANVRTYVRGPEGNRAVWFLTLEADRLLAVIGARSFYGLPYHWSQMQVEKWGNIVEYAGRRSFLSTPAEYRIRIRTGNRILCGELEEFLTARYRLYTTFCGSLVHTDVEHEPWRLQSAEVLEMRENLVRSSGLATPSTFPLVHFSAGVKTRISAPRLTGCETPLWQVGLTGPKSEADLFDK